MNNYYTKKYEYEQYNSKPEEEKEENKVKDFWNNYVNATNQYNTAVNLYNQENSNINTKYNNKISDKATYLSIVKDYLNYRANHLFNLYKEKNNIEIYDHN